MWSILQVFRQTPGEQGPPKSRGAGSAPRFRLDASAAGPHGGAGLVHAAEGHASFLFCGGLGSFSAASRAPGIEMRARNVELIPDIARLQGDAQGWADRPLTERRPVGPAASSPLMKDAATRA